MPPSHATTLLVVILAALLGCGGGSKPAAAPRPSAQQVFDMVAPSVVAILNDDRVDREEETKELERTLGDESKAPKHVIDVSLRKEPTPHGTGFMIQGGHIVTAAHVVFRPDRLKVTTRSGQTVDAELVRIDEVRDVAILKPKTPLPGVPGLALESREVHVGEPVWALGHTGHGYWALSWGMSEGIASGIVEMFGAKLLLFDGAVYPGFSGGPVVALDGQGKPHVVGVNHAILFTGSAGLPVAPISSAVTAAEVREVEAAHAPDVQKKLADYAQKQRGRVWADIFITDRLSVSRDPNDQQIAHIMGDARMLEAKTDGTRIPAVAMVFGLPKGSNDIEFEAKDPNGGVVATWPATVRVGERQRVSFVSGALRFSPKTHGRYTVSLKSGGKEIGHSQVALQLEEDDEDLNEEASHDVVDDGDPDVDIVVAMLGNDDPLALLGIRAAWAERSYPRRVGYTWFARGTRGWSGTNVSVSAFVLDDQGNIVGRSDGCFKPELRPEHTWSCLGSSGMAPPPLATKEGSYDIVFAINDRPVAWWPMEAAIRKDHAPGSDVERWMKEMKRVVVKRQKPARPEGTTPAPTTTPGPKRPPPAPAKPKKDPAN
jgi:S1-C subfamily serine protease